jgi:hypothetical protein
MMVQQFCIRSNRKNNLAITAAQEPSTNTAHNTTADNNKQATIAMLLSPQDVLKKGFHFFNRLPNSTGPWTERRTGDFKSHYGSSPIVLANQWYDLMTTRHNEMGPEGGPMRHPTYAVCVSAAYRPFCTSLSLFMPFF